MLEDGPGTARPRGEQRLPLDPFLLPSETDAHFALLIVVVIGASVLLFALLFNSIPVLWDAKTAAQDRCQAAAATVVTAATIAGDTERARLASECQRPFFLLQAGWELAGCILLLVGAVGLYWWLPARTIRRSAFRPLRPADAPELVAAIAELSRQHGLRHPPKLVWNPLNRSSGGVAFGHWGQRYLGLYGGTYLRFRRSPELFRAVVLHELAHIRNADLDKAGLAVTVWWAFLAVGLVPAGLGMLFGGTLTVATPVAFGWRVAALAALVVFTRAAVLRARELYADQRAAAWERDPDGITRAVGLLGEPPAAGRWRLPGFVGRALALHPSASERAAYLRDSSGLFRARLWVAVAAGMATTVALEGVGGLLANVLSFDDGLLSRTLAAIVFAPFAVGVIGLAVWRAELSRAAGASNSAPAGASDSTAGARALPAPCSAAALGLALGAGMFVGWHLSIASYALDTSEAVVVGGARLTFEFAFATIVLGSMALFVMWLQTSARAWIATITFQSRPLRRALLVSAGAATIVLVLWTGFITYAVHSGLAGQQLLNQSDQTPQLAEFGIPTSSSPEVSVLYQVFGLSFFSLTTLPLAPLGLALLWALPLAAKLLPGHAPLANRADLRGRAILLASLVAGVLAAPCSVALLLVLGDSGSPFLVAAAGVLLLAGFQAAAGLMVMVRATWLGAVQGLCSAHLTGAIAVLILVGAGAAFGAGVPAQIALSLFSGGTILATVPILMLAAVRGYIRSPARLSLQYR